MRTRRWLLSTVGGLLAIAAVAPPHAARAQQPGDDVASLLAKGDVAFARRADGADGFWAAGTAVDEALRTYERALELAPDDLTARSRVLRALFFQAEYVLREPDERKVAFERGRQVFEEGLERRGLETRKVERGDGHNLARYFDDEVSGGEYLFWGALHYGLWGQYFGRMKSVRRGIARKIQVYSLAATEIAPDFQDAGAFRLLGRLHLLAPRVPLLTDWIDRRKGLGMLEEAYRRAPGNPLNALFLGQALRERRRKRRSEAEALLRKAAEAQPRPEQLVEDRKAIADAQAALEEWGL